MHTTIFIRFYEELNDFLLPERKKQMFPHNFKGIPNIKDIIESLGVPHTEVDLIIVNGNSVDFHYKPEPNDHISVYPVFESLDISPINHLRPKPLRNIKFVLDVHLGKLAHFLRLLGFDTYYNNAYDDPEIVNISVSEHRIILTRDVNLLKNKVITHGYWVRNTNYIKQLEEVIKRLDLKNLITPFTRCLDCNGILRGIDKNSIKDKVPKVVSHVFENYHECQDCHKIYWEGSHYEKLKIFVDDFLKKLT